MTGRSLYLSAALPLVVAGAAATAGIILVGSIFKARLIHELALERAQSLSSITRNSIARAMRTGHRAELQVVLEEVGRDRDIAGVRILSADGAILRSARVDEVGQRLATHSTRTIAGGDLIAAHAGGSSLPEVLHTLEPIANAPECQSCHKAGGTIGLLDLDVNLARQMASVSAWWNWSLVLASLQFMLVVLLSAGVLGLLVVRPIRRLRVAMEQVRSGDLSVRVVPTGNREMDELVDGFNAMVGRLREAARAEEQAHRLQMERAERLAAVGQMAASLAHEIRNPLSGVKAVLELLAHPGQIVDPQRSMLAQALTELNRIETVVRDLLDYARPRTPTRAVVDLNEIARSAGRLLQPQATEAGAQLAFKLQEDLPAVSADPSMVRQVVINLVLNAVQAVAAAHDRHVAVSTEVLNNHVVCRVRDTGNGVPAPNAEAIFGAFFTTKARGTGLGLAISRRLIEAHGGQLWLENPGEAGASFAFTLPLSVPAH